MPIIGYRDTSSLVNTGAQDATVLRQFALRDGVTYDRVVAELEVAIRGLNGEFARHPLWRSLLTFQNEPALDSYGVGGGSGYADRMPEYGKPVPQHGETTGHMLPLQPWQAAMGWTWLKLKDMSMSEARDDISIAIDRMRNRYREQIFRRLLKRGDDSGKAKGLGTAGYSPGFATAAANTAVDYIPASFGGVDFTDAHEHYVAASGGWTTAILDDAEAELMEHGLTSPYRALVSTTDAPTITGLTGFVKAGTAVIQQGSGVAVALAEPEADAVDDGFRFLGSYGNTRFYATPGMPQHYGFWYKPFPSLSPKNPLRMRLEAPYEQPTARALIDPQGGSGTNPLQDLILYMEFGVGVANRLNGTARYVNNATWADGTAI